MPKLHSSTSTKGRSPYASSSRSQKKHVSFSEPEKSTVKPSARKQNMVPSKTTRPARSAASVELERPMTRSRTKAKEVKVAEEDNGDSSDDEPFYRTPAVDSPEDIRALFAHLQYSDEEMEELVDYMRRPHTLDDIPSNDDILCSISEEYCFGFYTRDSDILEFCRKHKKNYVPSSSTEAGLTEMAFITDYLSLLMNQRDVTLRRVVVTQDHKNKIPNIEERAGSSAFVLSIISSDHIDEPRYQPTNREVQELSWYLKQQPFWWETCD
ncbi:hypothetical protein EIP91_001938 [Steccherinum ochraceum]|uniref:Uncharacterized protein n=1 Tax=Steccherinum ochraceum TaxID=92696 RepID=A0A4R0RD56_9APHY|nr:hypothetical protein EIP91_001938 [Steccherinum ochraceum]